MTNADHRNDTAPLVLEHHEAAIQIALAGLSFPSHQSVKGRVLGALLRGEHLTHLDCWRRFGSSRLSHHIYMLRGIGWVVQMIEESVKTSDAGRSASIGIYFLKPDVISEAGERGQQYGATALQIEVERRAA